MIRVYLNDTKVLCMLRVKNIVEQFQKILFEGNPFSLSYFICDGPLCNCPRCQLRLRASLHHIHPHTTHTHTSHMQGEDGA